MTYHNISIHNTTYQQDSMWADQIIPSRFTVIFVRSEAYQGKVFFIYVLRLAPPLTLPLFQSHINPFYLARYFPPEAPHYARTLPSGSAAGSVSGSRASDHDYEDFEVMPSPTPSTSGRGRSRSRGGKKKVPPRKMSAPAAAAAAVTNTAARFINAITGREDPPEDDIQSSHSFMGDNDAPAEVKMKESYLKELNIYINGQK
jgi:hypothetical protein